MDSEVAGILVAVGFLVMGLVSMPVATWFVLGAIVLGVVVALLLRFAPKKFTRWAVGTVIILAAAVLWWEGHIPRRPRNVSSEALFVLPNNVPFSLHKTGYWLDCWFDKQGSVDRCKLTDEKGTESFETGWLVRLTAPVDPSCLFAQCATPHSLRRHGMVASAGPLPRRFLLAPHL
jgi:hypothetical protein